MAVILRYFTEFGGSSYIKVLAVRLILSATKNVTQKNLLFGDILRDY